MVSTRKQTNLNWLQEIVVCFAIWYKLKKEKKAGNEQ